MPNKQPAELGLNAIKLNAIDSIASNAITHGAAPGCVVLVIKDGDIAYHKAFGYFTYDKKEPVTVEAVYDLASVTKICATTLAIMKLYEEKKIELKKTIGDYLPWVKGSNKENILIEDLLRHQAGLVPFIPFYKEVIDADGMPDKKYFRDAKSDSFSINVADNIFMRNDWRDTMYKRILESPLTAANKYVYSDNDFIFLAKITEAVSGLPLDEYVSKNFYAPMALGTIGFRPATYLPLQKIAPTEQEPIFRRQLLRGYVHDPGAAMFGGVSGHAGLFSKAYDVAVLMQMLLNGGTFNHNRYLQQSTVDLFTSYQSEVSRRGYGFDKPEKDNATRTEPYPCKSASSLTFGHTGFTGTCVWVDPAYKLIYVFLSNRLNPQGGDNNKLSKMNVRSSIQEVIYGALTSSPSK